MVYLLKDFDENGDSKGSDIRGLLATHLLLLVNLGKNHRFLVMKEKIIKNLRNSKLSGY